MASQHDLSQIEFRSPNAPPKSISQHVHCAPDKKSPQFHDLTTTPGIGQRTASTADKAGSPRVTFADRLLSRVPFVQFDRPLDLHFGQLGVNETEQAIARQARLNHVVRSLRAPGYDADGAAIWHNQTVATFFHPQLDPIQRIRALICQTQEELNSLIARINLPHAMFGDAAGDRIKEDLLTRLFTEVMPELGLLSQNVAGKAAASLDARQAGRRFNVGRVK